MKAVKLLLLTLMIGVIFTGCMPAPTEQIKEEDINLVQFQDIAEDKEVAIFDTSFGTIKMVLFPEYAPNTVANFKALVAEGFYNEKPVYGVEKELAAFLVGATDERGSEGKVANGGKKIDPEVSYNLWHFPGSVSVIGDEKGFISKKIVADSRFFIVGNVDSDEEIISKMEEYKYPAKIIDAYKEKGGIPQYTGAYTIFAHVYEGLDIVNKIANIEVDEKTKQPVEPITINKVEIKTYKDAPIQEKQPEVE